MHRGGARLTVALFALTVTASLSSDLLVAHSGFPRYEATAIVVPGSASVTSRLIGSRLPGQGQHHVAEAVDQRKADIVSRKQVVPHAVPPQEGLRARGDKRRAIENPDDLTPIIDTCRAAPENLRAGGSDQLPVAPQECPLKGCAGHLAE